MYIVHVPAELRILVLKKIFELSLILELKLGRSKYTISFLPLSFKLHSFFITTDVNHFIVCLSYVSFLIAKSLWMTFLNT